MARKSRGRKRTYRRRQTGVKLIQAGATYVSLSAVTQMLFNNNAWNFFTVGWNTADGRGGPSGAGQGSQNMTMAEMIKSPNFGIGGSAAGETLQDQVRRNLNQNFGQGFAMLIGAAVVPKVISKLPGRPVTKFNRMLKQIGVGDLVKL